MIDEVIAWLAAQGVEAYLVGGCVRDRLLGRPIYDLDVATPADGLRLARRLANHFRGAYYPLDEARATGRAILPAPAGPTLVVDVARLRGGEPEAASLRSSEREAGSLAADLADRDFTINALAAPVEAPDEIIDLHDGMADLEARIIRPVSEVSIRRDPLRALRAVRFAAVFAPLGFRLAPETEALIRRDGAAVVNVAGERVRDELTRLLVLPYAAGFLAKLDELGLLTTILPELEPLRGLAQTPPHRMEALAHSLDAVRAFEAILGAIAASGGQLSADGLGLADHELRITHCIIPPLFRDVSPFTFYASRLEAHFSEVISDARPRLVVVKLVALLHDVGKAQARTVDEEGRIRFIGHHQAGSRMVGDALKRLRFDTTEVRLGETIVRNHMRPLLLAAQDGISARAVYRFFRDTGEAGVDVLVHALADHLATYGPEAEDDPWPQLVATVSRMLMDYWTDDGRRVSPPRLIDGTELMREFGLAPGPQIGELLEAVREAQVAGEVQTREQALALIRQMLNGQILKEE